MTGPVASIVRTALSGAYWMGWLYVATGLFFGDRVTPDGIGAPTPPLPAWAFAILTIALHAALSLAWDRIARTDRDR